MSLHGPNGFVRHFTGNAQVDTSIQFEIEQSLTALTIMNLPAGNDYELLDNAYGKSYSNFTGQTS